MPTRKASKEAKLDAELEAKVPATAKKSKKTVATVEATQTPETPVQSEHPAIAKIKAERKKPAPAPAPAPAPEPEKSASELYNTKPTPTKHIPCEIFSFADYEFMFYKGQGDQVRPVLFHKKELIFSGWMCRDYDSARSLVIPIYYTHSGELKLTQATIRPELLATHPLSALIYPEDNTGTIKESFEQEGNRTDLFRVVINPLGLALSGNTRLKVLQELAKTTGVESRVHVTITDGKNDVSIIVGGNKQREKTPQDRLREAIAIENARNPNSKYFATNVRNTFMEISGLSGGVHDATKAVVKFVAERKDSPIAQAVDKIAEQNPTVAVEIAKLQLASEGADGKPLSAAEQSAAIGKELGKMARIKSAQPIDTDKIYEGIQLDIANLRQYYVGETVPAMAQFLADCTPEMRERIITAKKEGNTDKLSILKARLEREDALELELETEAIDWNAQNDRDAAAEVSSSSPGPDPALEYYKKMRQMGISEDACWILNKSTAEALNGAIGGRADVDPFSEPTGNIECDRRILATERPVHLDDWGGGVHASDSGLKVVTALPPAPDVIQPFTTMMTRIEDGRIGEAAFIADAAVVFLPRFAAYFKSIPLAWILVARENNKEATEGFGFEPSPYLHSHPRYKKLTEDNWNDSQRAYVILYYGSNYDRFERFCGKYGNICYNTKAAAYKALQFEWEIESATKRVTAWNGGVKYEIDYIAGVYFLLVDGVRKNEKYKEIEHAKRAAVIESLNF